MVVSVFGGRPATAPIRAKGRGTGDLFRKMGGAADILQQRPPYQWPVARISPRCMWDFVYHARGFSRFRRRCPPSLVVIHATAWAAREVFWSPSSRIAKTRAGGRRLWRFVGRSGRVGRRVGQRLSNSPVLVARGVCCLPSFGFFRVWRAPQDACCLPRFGFFRVWRLPGCVCIPRTWGILVVNAGGRAVCVTTAGRRTAGTAGTTSSQTYILARSASNCKQCSGHFSRNQRRTP
jgi:hypothetical protein